MNLWQPTRIVRTEGKNCDIRQYLFIDFIYKLRQEPWITNIASSTTSSRKKEN